MNFDARSYCERMAKADCRFHYGGFMTRDNGRIGQFGSDLCYNDTEAMAWAFIGPLADELGVDGHDLSKAATIVYAERRKAVRDEAKPASLLESVFAACCEKLETVYAAEEEAV